MNYIDIHCHLDSKEFDPDREMVLAKMKELKIGAITIGADLESSKKAVEIAKANEDIWACIGVHPEGMRGDFDENEFENLIENTKVVGVGECGLDYFRLEDSEQKVFQKKIFEQQIQFAVRHNKPLMLHCRESYNDVLDILKDYKKTSGEKLRGNVHFFAGDINVVKKFLDLDFTLSFAGVITFARDYDEAIKYVPLNSIMSETDAPFVAPVPFRGKRNEPIYIIEIVKKLAEIRGENKDVLNNAIIENSKHFWGI